MNHKFPRFSFLSKNTPFKKLKRKLSNALESFLYNCATRNQQAILLSAIACRCPSCKKIGFLLVDTEVKVRYGGDDVVEDIGLDIFVWNPVGCGEEV